MAITDYKITEQQIAEKGVVAAPDMLTGTAQENKGVFDRLVRETVAPAFNSVLDALADENEQRNADEATRKAQETARVAAEELRVAAENGRVAAETARETAERQRADETAGIVAQATRQAAAAEAAKTATEDARDETIVHKNTAYRYALDAAISKNTAEASATEAGQQAGSASGFAARAEEALSKMGVHIGADTPANGAKLWLCPVNNPLVMNPDRATSDMTQEVGVNDDGKLVTTVEDGSVSESKLAQDVKDKFRSLSEEIANLGGGTGTGVPGPAGADGKSAYQYAQEGGYTGTEAEFAAKLAEEIPDKLPNPNALTFTGAVTGSYDGSSAVTVEIPSGGVSGNAENWRLVNTLTTAEDVSDIRITQDSDGNPLSLKKVKIFVKMRGNSASLSTWCRITVNNLKNNFYCDLQNTFAAKEGQDYYNYARADFAIYAGRLMLELLLRSANNAASKNTLWWVNNSGCFENYPDVVDAITSIHMWSTSAGIGAGTELMIYGVDA